MWLYLVCVCIFNLTFIEAQFDSYEINQIDLTPLHDAIIFKDIADIINEFENNLDPKLNKNIFSSSESSEDIEDLLSEYNHYLDKAHKQRINYIENSKGKNQVPIKRREKYTKTQTKQNKNDVSNHLNNMKYVQMSFPEPVNLLLSHSKKVDADIKPEFINRQGPYQGTPNDENAMINLIPTISDLTNPISSCYCKVNQYPCICGCKQCFILPDTRSLNAHDIQNTFLETMPTSSKYKLQNNNKKDYEDKLNIRVKIDVQLPKILSEFIRSLQKSQYQDRITQREGVRSNEIIPEVNLPFQYFDLPIPINLQKNNHKHDNAAVHKISIHKKKKSRLGNNSKKHMGKKIITFHSIKPDQLMQYNITNKKSESTSIKNKTVLLEEPKMKTKEVHDEHVINNVSYSTTEIPLKNTSSSIKTIYVMVNITKKNDSDTNESVKLENSIETDFIDQYNKSTAETLRSKRASSEMRVKNKTETFTHTPVLIEFPKKVQQSSVNYTKDFRKFHKTVAEDMELMYWPMEIKYVNSVKSKNITALILERENKKTKFNLTHDKIKSNRTIALEQAIFGDVDWNDVDTVAPVFLSFIGKYIRGILTFCSQSQCHSMKCAEKVCLHRMCTPDNRFNQKGHCSGNNETDSIAAMESIMDLPSNIGLEIVDILKDKMLGKMYGKATVCILSKCSTFIASKKNFEKSKCISKELTSLGHCPIGKIIKST